MTWDDSAENITSNMVSLKIKTENSSEIKVAGVPTPFDLYIPRVPPKGAPFTNRTFLKKKVDSVAYHRFNWTTEELPLFMIVKPNSTKAVFEIYIKEKERPNVKKDPLYLTLPDFSSCKVDALGKKNCEPYAIPINDTIVKTSGIYYLGLKLKSIGEESESRKRRDCGTGMYPRFIFFFLFYIYFFKSRVYNMSVCAVSKDKITSRRPLLYTFIFTE